MDFMLDDQIQPSLGFGEGGFDGYVEQARGAIWVKIWWFYAGVTRCNQ